MLKEKITYPIGNVCTHMGGPLAEGKLEGYEVECPWHNPINLILEAAEGDTISCNQARAIL